MEAYERLEYEWAKWNDLDPRGMVACSSGTAALHLALEAMRLPPGSEVIVPDLTMIAVPRAVTLAGLTPVFVDCDDTLNMDPLLVPKVDDKATVVMVVHVYGRQMNFDECRNRGAGPNWCWRDGMKIIEDLAEAHGVKPQQGTNAACWSFYKNKIVAGEEGGAVWFRNPEHAALARQLRNLGFTDAHDFIHTPRGHNYRMSNLHAQCILAKEPMWYTNLNGLNYYDLNLSKRREQEALLDTSCPPEWRMPPRQAPWVHDIRIPGMTSVQQDRVVRALNEIGIAARHCFKPCSYQEEYVSYKRVLNHPLHTARIASREVIYLPLTPGRPLIDKLVFDFIQGELDK